MEAAISAWLQDLAIRAFGTSLFLVLAIDATYAIVLLAGTGVGVPVLALSTRLAVRVVAPLIPSLPGVMIIDEDTPPPRQVDK